MGKNKIDIHYISDKTIRRATYKSRISGIVKKLNDLSILCGIQVCLVTTDTDSDLLTFSTSNDF